MTLTTELFGGSASKQSSSSNPVDLTPEEFKRMRGGFSDTLEQFYKSGGGPQYGGPFVAGMRPGEQGAIDQIQGVATDPARQQYLRDVLGGKYLPGQEGANPFFDAAVRAAQRPTLQGLQETLSRSLPGKFAVAGQFSQGGGAGQPATGGSSAFNRAGAIATQASANMLSDIGTNMGNEQFKNERTNQQQAVALQQQDVDALMKNLQAQGLPRMIEDMGIERGLQEFQRRSEGLLKALQIASQVTAPVTGQSSTSTGTSTSSKGIFPGLFPKGLGGGSMPIPGMG